MLLLEANSITFIATNSLSREQSQCPSRKSDWLTRSQLIGQQVWKNAQVSKLPVNAFSLHQTPLYTRYVFLYGLFGGKTSIPFLYDKPPLHTFQGDILTAVCIHPSVLTFSLLMCLPDNHLPLPPDFHKEHSVSYLPATQLRTSATTNQTILFLSASEYCCTFSVPTQCPMNPSL